MTQRESRISNLLGRPRTVAPARFALLFVFCAIGCASANEFTRSDGLRDTLPPRCAGGDAERGASGDAGNCVRITGYIAAGAILTPDEGTGGRPGRFGFVAAPEIVTGRSASPAAIVDQSAGARPMFLRATHDE